MTLKISIFIVMVYWVICLYAILSLNNSNRAMEQMRRVFVNGPGDQGSITCLVISKTQKLVLELDTALVNTQHYKVKIKGME